MRPCLLWSRTWFRSAFAGLLVMAFVVASVTHTALAEPASGRFPWSRVRCLSPAALSLAEEGAARSPLLRSLLDRIEQGNIVVYVNLRPALFRTSPRGGLRFITTSGGLRFLVAEVESWYANRLEQMATLAHELQHALEVANASEVVDEESFAALYAHIGWGLEPGCFETDLARRTEARVLAELLRTY